MLSTPSRKVTLALAAAFTLFFAPQLFTTRVPYYRDTLVTMIPFRAVIHDRLRKFELPQWYPREGIGVPFIGQVNTGTFHPQTALFLWLSPIQAVKWNLLLMYALSLAGAYRFARALGHDRGSSAAAAVAFAFGGYALGVSHNLSYAGPHATLPWIAAFGLRLRQTGSRRHLAALAVALALVFLQGDAQAYLHAGFILLATLLLSAGIPRRRAALLLAAAGGLSLLLMAPELLPAITVARDSLRGVGERSATLGLTWALHPFRVFELFMGGFVPDVVRNEYTHTFFAGGRALWATTLFFGASALALLFAGTADAHRRLWPYLAVAALAFWLSLGDRGGLLPLFCKVLPLAGKFRYPEKYLSLFWVMAVPLVAAGGMALSRSRRAHWALAAVGVAAALGAVIVGRAEVVAALRGPATASAGFDAAVADAWRVGLLRTALLLLLCALVLWRASERLRLPALAALVFIELYHVNSPHLPTIAEETLTATNAIAQAVRPGARTVREVSLTAPSTVSLGDGEVWALGTRQSLRANSNELDRVATLETNSPGVSWRYGMLEGARGVPLRTDLFHGCYRVSTTARLPVFRDPETNIALEELPCLPRAYVAPAVAVKDAGEAMGLLDASRATVLVVEGGESTSTTSLVNITVDEPEHVELELSVAGRSAVYLADQFASGWTATDNGRQVPIHPANVAARAVYVDAGTHNIAFRYRAPGLKLGLVLGGLGWLVVAALGMWRVRARPPRPDLSRTP